jgi:transaldolase / glucose-6-phosphate isomerase
VVGEPLGNPDVYGADRLFVHLRKDGDETFDEAIEDLVDLGHPLVRIHLGDPYDLGFQLFLWEMATAVAGSRMGINPFDQPNVESAKRLARETVVTYLETGILPEFESRPLSAEVLQTFVAPAGDVHPIARSVGSYVAIHAYVAPTPETDDALLRLRISLRDHLRVAVTAGYGPRFLHSTGQLHKGDAGNGFFVQLVSTNFEDVPIPDEAGSRESKITFGILKKAQALGDARALAEAGRRIIRFDIDGNVAESLNAIAESLEP